MQMDDANYSTDIANLLRSGHGVNDIRDQYFSFTGDFEGFDDQLKEAYTLVGNELAVSYNNGDLRRNPHRGEAVSYDQIPSTVNADIRKQMLQRALQICNDGVPSAFIVATLADDNCKTFLQRKGLSIIGFGCFLPNNENKTVSLELLCAERGGGSQILNNAEAYFNEQGFSQMNLESVDNAKPFYEKMGYQQLGAESNMFIKNLGNPTMAKTNDDIFQSSDEEFVDVNSNEPQATMATDAERRALMDKQDREYAAAEKADLARQEAEATINGPVDTEAVRRARLQRFGGEPSPDTSRKRKREPCSDTKPGEVHAEPQCEGKRDPVTFDNIKQNTGVCLGKTCFDYDSLVQTVRSQAEATYDGTGTHTTIDPVTRIKVDLPDIARARPEGATTTAEETTAPLSTTNILDPDYQFEGAPQTHALEEGDENWYDESDNLSESSSDDGMGLDADGLLDMISRQPQYLGYATDDVKNDKDYVLKAVQRNGIALKYALPSMQRDKDVVLAAVSQNRRALEFASPSLQEDKQVVLAATRSIIESLPLDITYNEISEMVQEVFDHVGPKLLADKDFILAAIDSSMIRHVVLDNAAAELLEDKEFMLSVVSIMSRKGVDNVIFDELATIMESELQSVQTEGFFDEDLQILANNIFNRDRDFIMRVQAYGQAEHAVSRSSDALQYAGRIVRQDKEVALAAIDSLREFSYNMPYDEVSMELKKILVLVGPKLRADKDFILKAIEISKNPHVVLENAAPELLKDKEFMLSVVAILSNAYNDEEMEYLAKNILIRDKDFIMTSVLINPRMLHFLPEEFQNDEEIVLQALRSKNPIHPGKEALLYTDLVNDRDFALRAVRVNGLALQTLIETTEDEHWKPYQNDQEIAIEAVKQNSQALRYVSPDLRRSEAVLDAAAGNARRNLFGNDDD